MKFDIRLEGQTVQSFDSFKQAVDWKKYMREKQPDKVFSIVKDYGKVGE